MSTQRFDELFMQCCKCLNQFSHDRIPQLLPCLHAVCSKCAQEATGEITCPQCPDSTPANSLQMDLVRWNELMISSFNENPTTLLCSNKSDGKTASHYCRECVCLLCENCYDVHQQLAITRTHNTCLLENIPKRDAIATLTCPHHPGVVLRYYNIESKSMTCQECMLNDVECRSSEHIVASREDKLVTPLLALETNLTTVVNSMSSLENQSQAMNECETLIIKNVNCVFDALKDKVESRRSRVLSKVKDEFTKMTSLNSDRLAQFGCISRRWKGTVDYCQRALTLSTQANINAFRDVMTSKLDQELNTVVEDANTFSCDDISVDFSPNIVRDVEKKIHNIGHILKKFNHIVCLLTRNPRVGSYEIFGKIRFETESRDDDVSLPSITAWLSDGSSKMTSCNVHKMTRCERTTYGISARLASPGQYTLTTNIKDAGFAESIELIASSVDTTEDRDLFVWRLMGSQLPEKTTIKQPSLSFDKETIDQKSIYLREDGVLTNALTGYWTKLKTFIHKENSRQTLVKIIGAVACRQLPHSGIVYWEVESSWNKKDVDLDSAGVLQLVIADPNQMNNNVEKMFGKTGWGVSLHHSLMYGGMCLTPSNDTKGQRRLSGADSCRLGFLLNMDVRKMRVLDVESNEVVASFDSIDSIIPLCFAAGLYNGNFIESSVRIISGWELHLKSSTLHLLLNVLDNMLVDYNG